MPESSFASDRRFMDAAFAEATADAADGAIPIGAALVYDDGKHQEVFLGRNRRVQDRSAILHAEMDCLEKAQSRPAEWFQYTTLYTTLFPCTMCSGAVALFAIPRVVIGEAKNFPSTVDLQKGRAFLELYGVQYQILDDRRCQETLRRFIETHAETWTADVPYQTNALRRESTSKP